MTHYVEWRAYVGPMWKPDTDSAFWDWSALDAGDTYAPETAIASTTVATSIAALDMSVVLTDASTWPSAGSAFVGPGDTGEAWEQISWTGKSSNTLTGVSRETVDGEQTGVHTAGAVARFWWPLATNDGALHYVPQFDDRMVVVDWSAEISGVAWPQVALRNQNLILVQWRWDTGAGLGSWQNALVGWLDSPQGRDDAERLALWGVRINSSLGVLRYDEADGVRVGAVDLANGASVAASSTLATARVEQHTGDFTGEPTFGAGNTLDGDSGTLWISDRYVGEDNPPTGSYLSQLHISAYVGQGDGYRWIELYAGPGGTINDWIIAGPDRFVNCEAGVTANDSGLIILAENPTLFEEENPDYDAALISLESYQIWDLNNHKVRIQVTGNYTLSVTTGAGTQTTGTLTTSSSIDDILAALDGLSNISYAELWAEGTSTDYTITVVRAIGAALEVGIGATGSATASTTQTGGTPFFVSGLNGADIFNYIDPAGGNIRLYDGTLGPHGSIVWGDAWPFWVWDWTGSTVTAPEAGQTMRRIFSPASPSVSADYWQTSYVSTPGYSVTSSSKVWLLYNLPRLDLRLDADIDNSQTTGLVVADAAGPSGDGLPDSETLQIGSEQISYTSIDRSTGALSGVTRGANSTTAASHSADDKVYIVDSGVATDGRLLESITLTLPDTISAKLSDFVVRGSMLSTARTPDDANYTDDYSTLATASNNTDAEYTITLSPSQRLRWVLVEITEMTVSPARPRLAEVSFAEDMSVYGASTVTDATVADAVTVMLDNAGIPSDAIIDGGDTSTIDNYTTASDAATAVLSEVCEFAGARVTVGRDSKITIAADPFWASGSLPSTTLSFDADDIAVYEKVDTNGRGVGQVELSWRNAADTESGIEKYPVTRVTGRVARVGPIVRASSSAAQAAAQKRYWMMRRPYTVVAELQDAYTLTAGEVHQVAWDLDDEMLPIDRTYMVVGADHQIKDNAMVTVAQYIQISRSDER